MTGLWRSPWLPIGLGMVAAITACEVARVFLARFDSLFGGLR